MSLPDAWLIQARHRHHVKRQWRKIYVLLAVSAVLMSIAAYGIKPSVARHAAQGFIEATSWHFPEVLHARFGAYERPWNAVLALMVAWTTSPLQLLGGYICFTAARPDVERIWSTSTMPLPLRALLCLALAGIFAFVLVALPGIDSVFCRGCEQRSMLFMLIVTCVGLVIPGVCLAAAIFALRLAIFDRQKR